MLPCIVFLILAQITNYFVTKVSYNLTINHNQQPKGQRSCTTILPLNPSNIYPLPSSLTRPTPKQRPLLMQTVRITYQCKHQLNSKAMGNKPTPQNFKQDEWQLIDRTVSHILWKNLSRGDLIIEEYDRFATQQFSYNLDKDIFEFRYNSPYLVAGVFFQESEDLEFCSTNYKYRVFIENIPIRLTDIEHIPFPDILHLYHQCLNGFHLLAMKLGYFFEVEESYIGINGKGVVKAWLSKYLANHSSIGGKITQQQMVKSIIDIVDKNSDPYQASQNIPTVKSYLYRNSDALRFDQANRQLQAYIAAYNRGVVPSKLDCVDHAGGVYSIASRPQAQYSQESIDAPPLNSRYLLEGDPNRPQLVNISQSDIAVGGSYEKLQSTPPVPSNPIPKQPNLKASETFNQLQREKVIANPAPVPALLPFPVSVPVPVQLRQKVEANRARSGHEKHLSVGSPANINIVASPSNNMKYSQTIQQIPSQSRQLNFSRNLPSNIPLQNNPQAFPIPTFSSPSSPNIIRFDAPVRRLSPVKNIDASKQQIQSKQPKKNLSISPNPSLAFSSGPTTPSSQPSNYSANQPNMTKTNSQKFLYPQLSPLNQSSGNFRRQFMSEIQPNSHAFNVQPTITKKESNHNISEASKEVPRYTEINGFAKTKQVDFSPWSSQQKKELLSFNPSFSLPTVPYEPFTKPSVPQSNNFQTKYEADLWSNKPSEINPNDGKSSQQFLAQLRQLNDSFVHHEKSQSSFIPDSTATTNNYGIYNKPLSRDLYQDTNLRSYGEISTPAQSKAKVQDEQFGRIAVSHIIQNSEPSRRHINAFANTQPLKFQNGLAMKQSRFQADQPQQLQFKKSPYGMYEGRVDSSLVSGLSRPKK